MSAQDPRILILILDNLIDELRRWNITTSDTLREMSWHQRQAQEKVDQALHHAGIVVNRATQDRQEVNNAIQEVAQLLSNCQAAINNALHNLNQAQQQQRIAESTFVHWQRELTAALAWLERAKARLARAIQERQAAETALSSAQFALSSAQSALSSCESSGYRDKEGRYHQPDCSGYRASVSSAQAEVFRAQQRLNTAIVEEQAAKVEVAQAQARVNCCQNAVGYSHQAVSHASVAVEQAHQALNAAERSLENAKAAQRAVNGAQEEAIAEQEAADLMVMAVRASQDLTGEANDNFQNAQKMGDSAQRLATIVSQELEDRVEHLIELNRPLPLF